MGGSTSGEAAQDDVPMLGHAERSLWDEQKYSRSLMIQAKHKILRGKAYEVPEEMMTMTTDTRPKYKPEGTVRKDEKDIAEPGREAADDRPEDQAETRASPALAPASSPDKGPPDASSSTA